MPYIKSENRDQLHKLSIDVCDELFRLGTPIAGNLNFFISSVLNMVMLEKGISYTLLNELIGVLECTKLEVYRRMAAPYEDAKISENGDVYNTQT